VYAVLFDPESETWWVDGLDIRRTLREITQEEAQDLMSHDPAPNVSLRVALLAKARRSVRLATPPYRTHLLTGSTWGSSGGSVRGAVRVLPRLTWPRVSLAVLPAAPTVESHQTLDGSSSPDV
jgi:hypothetical protein